MTKTASIQTARRWHWTPAYTLYTVLSALVLVVFAASFTGNPFGAYFAAYVSTALVIFGLFDLVRKLRHRASLKLTLPILATGLLTGFFMNMAQVLGPSVYLAFLIGQVFTVGLVLWLSHITAKASR